MLGGGAVRGAAHVGVLEVLEDEGIQPQLIVGSSVGSIVGAAAAAGLAPADIAEIFREVRWSRLTRISLGRFMGLLNPEPLEQRLLDLTGTDEIEQLETPFAAVACDLTSGERVVLDHGPLGPAIRASSAVPGVFPPVPHENRLLIDGAVVDDLPVGVARAMGADYVIAVDLVPEPRHHQAPCNALEVVISAGFLWSRANHPDPSQIDCLIAPDVSEFFGWDFHDVPELEVRGRAAAQIAASQLRRDLHT